MFKSPETHRSSSYPDLSTPTVNNNDNINLRKRRKPDCECFEEIKAMIQNMSDQYSKKNDDLVETMRQDNAKLLESQEELKQIIVANVKQYNELKKKVDVLSADHASAIKKIVQLETQLEEVQRTQNKNKLELRNVPRKPDEDLTVILSSLYKSLNINQETLCVNEVYRRGGHDNAPIVVEYTEPKSCETTQQGQDLQ